MRLGIKLFWVIAFAGLLIGCAPTPPNQESAQGAPAPPVQLDRPDESQTPIAESPKGASENPSVTRPPVSAAGQGELARLAGVYFATVDDDALNSRLELKADGTFLNLTRFKDKSPNVETTGVWKLEGAEVVLQLRKTNGRSIDPKWSGDTRLKVESGGRKLTEGTAGLTYERG